MGAVCAVLALGGAARAATPPGTVTLSAAASEATALQRDGVPPTDTAVAATLPDYLQGRSAHFLDWLADGSLLIATRFADTWQIHQVRAPLGMRAQVSFEPEGVLTAAVQPFSSDTLVYVAAHGAGTQLVLEQLHDRSRRALTDGSDLLSEPAWSPDGQQLAFVSNRRGPGDADVYVLDARTAGATPRLVASAPDGERWRIDGWSADAHRLLLTREAAAAPAGAADADSRAPGDELNEGALYIANLSDGSVTAVSAGDSARTSGRRRHARGSDDAAVVRAAMARFASDGSGIVLLTHTVPPGSADSSARQFLHLALLDPANGQWRELSAPSAHDAELFDSSSDGHYLAYTLNDAGQSRLMLIDQRLRLERQIGAVPSGVISSLRFDASGQHLALTLESARAPPDVYVLDLATGALTRWTQSEVGPLTSDSFVEPRLLTFPTWDRIDGELRQLQALAYEPGPDSIGAGAPRPVVIWLCSGAGTQCRPGYDPFIQYLTHQLGAVVIAPDVRGSSGLGANLLAAGAGTLREDAPRDVGALLAWIGVQPALDRSHVALLGEGYGGYLALESLSQYADRLLGAVVAFPPPLAGLPNVAEIRAPVLLVQAGSDAGDAPGYEVAQLREGLRSQGVTVQYLAAQAADAFSRRPARAAYHAAVASFLARLLRAGAPG